MKYMITLCYGNDGRAVVEAPPIDRYLDEESVVIAAAIDAGYLGYYPFDDIVEEFIDFSNEEYGTDYTMEDAFRTEEFEEEFWRFADDCGYRHIEQVDGFVQDEGLFIQPVPPNYEVGVIEYGENPKLKRYQGMGR